MPAAKQIAWDKDKLADFKVSYQQAVAERKDEFQFVEYDRTKGILPAKVATHLFNTRYAKYLIEFLDPRLNAPQREYPPNREGKEGE